MLRTEANSFTTSNRWFLSMHLKHSKCACIQEAIRYKYIVMLNIYNDFLDSAEVLCTHVETVPSKKS